MFLGSNLSIDDLIRYSDLPQHVIDKFIELTDRIDYLEGIVSTQIVHDEDDEEQVSCAKELLDDIERELSQCQSAEQAKEIFARCCRESWFER